MWGISGPGFGLLFKAVAMGIAAILVIFAFSSEGLAFWAYIAGSIVVLGMGFGAWGMLSDLGNMASAPVLDSCLPAITPNRFRPTLAPLLHSLAIVPSKVKLRGRYD